MLTSVFRLTPQIYLHRSEFIYIFAKQSVRVGILKISKIPSMPNLTIRIFVGVYF